MNAMTTVCYSYSLFRTVTIFPFSLSSYLLYTTHFSSLAGSDNDDDMILSVCNVLLFYTIPAVTWLIRFDSIRFDSIRFMRSTTTTTITITTGEDDDTVVLYLYVVGYSLCWSRLPCLLRSALYGTPYCHLVGLGIVFISVLNKWMRLSNLELFFTCYTMNGKDSFNFWHMKDNSRFLGQLCSVRTICCCCWLWW